MKVVIAIDSLKGSLSSMEAGIYRKTARRWRRRNNRRTDRRNERGTH